jgi:hypothetical protein
MAGEIASGLIGGTKRARIIIDVKVPAGVSEAQFKAMVAQNVSIGVGFLPILAGTDIQFTDVIEGL